MKIALFGMVVANLAVAQTGPLMQSILPRYELAKANLIETADAMPGDQYEYKLTPEQRSFGGWIEHNIGMNYGQCAAIKGEPAPDLKKYASSTPKDELSEALKKSFEFCDEAFKSMTDQKALTETTVAGKTVLPANIMIGLIANWNAHYGNLVGYMRTKGVVPPSTARTQKKK